MHEHAPLTHSHSHQPDLHHRHTHEQQESTSERATFCMSCNSLVARTFAAP
jgi:hypothetical protein